MLALLISGASLGFPASILPGPLQMYLLSKSVQNGWKKTLPTAFAPLLSDGPIIAIVVFVLAQIPEVFLNAIKIVGGIYVLYLAFRAWQVYLYSREHREGTDSPIVPSQVDQSILEASLLNLLNPNPYIFWSTIGAVIVIEAWKKNPIWALAFLFSFYVSMITTNAVQIYIFGTSGNISPKVRENLTLISAVALSLFGVYQLATGVFVLKGIA